MKRFLALFLALLMCVGVFASCKKKGDGDSTVTLEQAKDYLYNVMKDKNGKEIPNDYDVVGKIIIEGVTFDVTWKTDNENIKIKESSKANMWTVDLPEVNAYDHPDIDLTFDQVEYEIDEDGKVNLVNAD